MGKEVIRKTRAHVYVSGRVQGVFFRESTFKMAQKLNIFGWVRNLEDGRVEAVFEGEEEKIKKIIDWTKRGPIFAKVEKINIIEQDYQEEFEKFEIK